MNTILRLILLVAGIFAGSAAHAQTSQTAYAGGNPIVLTIPVTAAVGVRCGFAQNAAPAGSYSKDNFDREGLSARFDFGLDCNAPSRVAVASTNRGLLNQASAAAGYTNRWDYNVTLSVASNDGTRMESTCAASALTSGSACAFAGTASSTQGVRLASAAINQPGSFIRITAPANTGATVLVQGTYRDSLVVTISPAL